MKGYGLFFKMFVGLSFLAMIIINMLAVLLPINGISTGAVSDAYPNLFAPAGITFSIWSVIYLFLGAYTLYYIGFFHSSGEQLSKENQDQIALLFSASSLVNIAWIFAWQYRIIPLSVVLMVVLLLLLIKINCMIRSSAKSRREDYLIRIPFNIYFGWITIATIANFTVLFISLGWDGFSLASQLWMVAVLILGTAIGVVTAFFLKSISYTLVLIWAYLGILYKHLDASGFFGCYPVVIFAVSIALAVFVIEVTYLWIKSDRRTIIKTNNTDR